MSCSYPFIQPNYGSNSSGGSGTVTSVALSLPAMFTVSGSPVTTAGTLTATLANQTAGKILAAPPTSTGTPTFLQVQAEHLNPTYSNGQVLTTNGSGVLSWTTVGGSGTVTSVGLSLPGELTVTNSPVTTTGTLTGTWANQTAGKIFAAPPTSTSTPSFLQIQAEHLNATYSNTQILQTNGSGVLSWVAKPTGTVTSVGLSLPSEITVSGSPVTTTGTLTGTWANQTAGKILAAPPTSTGTPTFLQVQAEHLNATYSNGQYLTTNGSGVLSWATVSAGTPASPTNSVQYNNSGAFGGSSNFTFNGTALQYTNSANAAGFIIQQTGSGSAGVGLAIIGSSSTENEYLFGAESNGMLSTSVKVAYFNRSTNNSTRAAVHINDVPTSTPQPAFIVTASASNSSTIESNKPVIAAWNNQRIGLRLSTNPTLGHVQMPWVTGDTLPTLYVGNTSSNKNAISAVNNGDGTAPNAALYASSYSYGAHLVSQTTSALYMYSPSYTLLVENTGYGCAAWFKQAYTSALVDNMFVIHTNGVTGSTYQIFKIYDGSTNFVHVSTVGVTSVRSGLSTDNKMTDVGGVYFTSTTDVGNVGTGEDNLSTVTLTANVLGTDGDRIEAEGSFVTVNNADAKTLKFYFGSYTFTYSCSAYTAGKLVVKITIIRVSNTSQKVYATVNESTTSGSTYVSTASETLSSNVTVKFTGEATSNNDIVQNTFTVKYFPKGGAS